MGNKLTLGEEKVVDKVIEEIKKLVKKYGYEYSVKAMQRYTKNTKEKQKLVQTIKIRKKSLRN